VECFRLASALDSSLEQHLKINQPIRGRLITGFTKSSNSRRHFRSPPPHTCSNLFSIELFRRVVSIRCNQIRGPFGCVAISLHKINLDRINRIFVVVCVGQNPPNHCRIARSGYEVKPSNWQERLK
jgi:hypothetical protein